MDHTCLQCHQRPKRKDYTFCSKQCSKAAADNAPQLLKVPVNHVMYRNVADAFYHSWEGLRMPPKIFHIYLITWTHKQRSSFDDYRDQVEARGNFVAKGNTYGNEVKRFRSERRACHLGEYGHQRLCCDDYCFLCKAIRTGFKSSLQRKRNLPGDEGIRLGRGVYTTPTSSKACEYAVNLRNQPLKAVIDTRVVLGKPHRTKKEHHGWMKPPHACDSVEGVPGPDSEFDDKECVVYNEDAIRPAYLIMIGD